MLAQGAVGFIKQGCAMLHEGRMELEGAKKTVEGVLADVKAISPQASGESEGCR